MSLESLKLQSVLGQGGMGRVWQVSHPEHSLPLALKLLSADIGLDALRSASIEREMEVLASLDHPGVVRLLDWGFINEEEAQAEPRYQTGSPWLLTECAQGLQVLEVLSGMAWPRLQQAIVDLLATLAHLHSRGWIHRDISPGNVLWSTRDRRPKLVDFGLSVFAGSRTSQKGGTRGFSAPEQIQGGSVGPWTDLYSLGVLLEESLAWRKAPLVGPKGFSKWLHRLVHPDPLQRFRRAADALNGLLGAGETLLVPECFPPRSKRPNLRWARPSPSLFPFRDVPIVGREGEQKAIWEALRRAHQGDDLVVIQLQGAPGVGVQRLMTWLGREAHALGVAEVLRSVEELLSYGAHRLPVLLLRSPTEKTLNALQKIKRDRSGLVLVNRGEQTVGESLVLGPIPDAKHGALVRSFLPVSPRVCGWVIEKSAGHPGETYRYLADLLDDQALCPSGGLLDWKEGAEPVLESLERAELESEIAALIVLVEGKNMERAWQKERVLSASFEALSIPVDDPMRLQLWQLRVDVAQELNHAETLKAVISLGVDLLAVFPQEKSQRTLLRRLLSVARRAGRFSESVKACEDLLLLVEGSSFEAKATWEWSYSMGLKGAFQSAYTGFEKAVSLAEEYQDDRVQRHGFAGLALACSWMGNFSGAHKALDSAEALFIAAGHTAALANLADLRGCFFLGEQDAISARKWALCAIEKYADQGRLSPLVPLINLAAAEHALGNRERVEILLDQIHREALEREERLLSVVALYQLIYASRDAEWSQWDDHWCEHMLWWERSPEWHPSHGRLLMEVHGVLRAAGKYERCQRVADRLKAQFDHVGWDVARAWGVERLVSGD